MLLRFERDPLDFGVSYKEFIYPVYFEPDQELLRPLRDRAMSFALQSGRRLTISQHAAIESIVKNKMEQVEQVIDLRSDQPETVNGTHCSVAIIGGAVHEVYWDHYRREYAKLIYPYPVGSPWEDPEIEQRYQGMVAKIIYAVG